MPKFLNEQQKKDFYNDEDDDIVDKVEDNLSNLGDDEEDDVELPEEPEKEDKAKDEPEDKIEDELKDKEEDKSEEDETVIPEEYIDAAEHSGWTREEIREAVDENPELALKLLKKNYDSVSFTTKEASELGKVHRKQVQENIEKETKKDKQELSFKKIDLDELKKKFGEDSPELLTVVEALSQQNEQLFDAIQMSSQSVQQTVQPKLPSDEQQEINNTIGNFFESMENESHTKFYGATKKEDRGRWGMVLTGEQLARRQQVVQEADSIYAGFQVIKKPISYQEALRRAHLITGSSVNKQTVREEISKDIKKRRKGITVKTTGKKHVKSDALPKDPKKREKTVLNRAKARMGKLFGSAVGD